MQRTCPKTCILLLLFFTFTGTFCSVAACPEECQVHTKKLCEILCEVKDAKDMSQNLYPPTFIFFTFTGTFCSVAACPEECQVHQKITSHKDAKDKCQWVG